MLRILIKRDYKETHNRLIQRHVDVDRTCPGIDPALQINHMLDILLLQILDDPQAAHTVMTDHHAFSCFANGFQVLRNFSHRNIDTTG